MKKVLEIGDLHVGSEYGLNHPDYMSAADRKESDGPELYDRLCEVRDAAGKCDIVLVMGDTCDGANPKERGDDRTASEDRQVKIAAKLLRDIKGSPKFYCVDGSGYHRGVRRLDEMVADKVGAVMHPHYLTRAPPVFDIKVENVYFNIAHFISVSKSTWQYQTTSIAREEVLVILNRNPGNIILRGHCHYFVLAGYLHHLGMVCPGWQTKTPFQGRISPVNEYRIGSVIFDIKDDSWNWDDRFIWETKAEIVTA